jgi:hypothetical protein
MKHLGTKNKRIAVLNRLLLLCVMCFLSMPIALAQKHHSEPEVSIGGVYENLTAGKESGDLEGMRVIIFAAGGAYRAIVQSAEGGADDPQPNFAPVTVNGMNVEFAVGERKFTGTVAADGLRLKDHGLLKRKDCSAFFKVGP